MMVRISFAALVMAIVLTSCSTGSAPPSQTAFPAVYRSIKKAEKTGRTVVYPVAIHSIKPTYPALPASGQVSAAMRVGPEGTVGAVKVIGEAPEAYVRSIENALMQWRFRPGTVDGRAETFAMSTKLQFKGATAAKGKEEEGISVDTRKALLLTAYPALHQKLSGHWQRGERVELPRVSKTVPPRHPAPFSDGTTWVTFVVNERGRVEDVRFFGNTPRLFQEAIQEALRQWEFHPAKVNGKPHRFPVAMPQTFKTNKVFMLKP